MNGIVKEKKRVLVVVVAEGKEKEKKHNTINKGSFVITRQGDQN